ncbi:carbohydrate ABC transporter permease [Wenjunlia tyrosinilytica]|nr:sugar ABC transporter permease [Wenjunlia tyrosinilytica]
MASAARRPGAVVRRANKGEGSHASRHPRGRHARKESLLRAACLVPPLALLAMLVGYPLVETLRTSVMRSTFIQPETVYVGLDNFSALLSADEFWAVVRNSVIWTAVVVSLQFVLGLAAAILLSKRFRGRTALRAVVIVPWVMPGIIAGVLWKLVYDPYLGPLNNLLGGIGPMGGNPAWLGATGTALFAVCVAAVWKGFPLSTVMYMAAYQNVPQDMRDAARIDGAGRWREFWHVTLPSMASTMRTTVLLTMVWTFNYFDLVYVMTKGGPGVSTEIFPTVVYRQAFSEVNYGVAAAYGVVSVLVLSVFTALYLRQLNRVGGLR